MSNFVERLNSLLKERNLSIRQLSREVGISSSQLSKYSTGYYEPSLSNALKLADYFSCSLDYLFGLEPFRQNAYFYREPDKKVFVERFKELVERRKTNFNRISKHTYLNRNTIYNWETTANFPKVGILVKLAQELNVSIEFLIGRID